MNRVGPARVMLTVYGNAEAATNRAPTNRAAREKATTRAHERPTMTQAAKHAPMKLAACKNAATRATCKNLANAETQTGRPGMMQNETKNAVAEARATQTRQNQLKEKLPAA